MAKVVALRGHVPDGWSKERFKWLKSVTADSDLLPMSRLVASVLAVGFSNHETGECRPGLTALMRAVGASKSTILRALAQLAAAGWIDQRGGNAPNVSASYVFRWPEQVSSVRPEQVSPVTRVSGEQVSSVRPEQVSPVTQTGVMQEAPPIPPYKDKPNMNQITAQNPRAAIRGLQQPKVLTHLIAANGSAAGRWDEWLLANGYPALSEIGRLRDGQYRMPVTVAPRPDERVPFGIAVRWADWLRSIA